MNKKKYKLGHWQVASLESIRDKKVCCDLKILGKVAGTAKKWDYKYKKSLRCAIAAHNEGIASNSPIDPQLEIVLDQCGYVLVPRKP